MGLGLWAQKFLEIHVQHQTAVRPRPCSAASLQNYSDAQRITPSRMGKAGHTTYTGPRTVKSLVKTGPSAQPTSASSYQNKQSDTEYLQQGATPLHACFATDLDENSF